MQGLDPGDNAAWSKWRGFHFWGLPTKVPQLGGLTQQFWMLAVPNQGVSRATLPESLWVECPGLFLASGAAVTLAVLSCCIIPASACVFPWHAPCVPLCFWVTSFLRGPRAYWIKSSSYFSVPSSCPVTSAALPFLSSHVLRFWERTWAVALGSGGVIPPRMGHRWKKEELEKFLATEMTWYVNLQTPGALKAW